MKERATTLHLTPAERCAAYAAGEPGQKWPDSVPHVGGDNRIYAMWILGQDYRSKSGFYGSYPPNYLMRMHALYPELATLPKERVLHLFSGSVEPGNYIRFDVHEDRECDVPGDAHELDQYFAANQFDLIFADPPYTNEDADRYGTSPVQRNKVLASARKVLAVGGQIIWLDQIMPMFTKDRLSLTGAIGVVRSTNHRFRCATFYTAVDTKPA